MRILVFRLSSLGDLILSLAFLENLPEGARVDWVVSSDFAFVLKGHPKVNRIWAFDKKEGLSGWIRLIRLLGQESFDFRVDLHRNLRTFVAFSILSFFEIKRGVRTPVHKISKQRLRTFFLLLLKGAAPKQGLPLPYWRRFGELAFRLRGTTGTPNRPSFLPTIAASGISETQVLDFYQLTSSGFFSVMPSSRWETKEWGVDHFLELIERLQKQDLIPVLLGREKDRSCFDLRERLRLKGIPFRDALSESDFVKTAILLKHSRFYVGCDTGLSHLAESVNCRAYVIFGPTRPELGFGPARVESRAISKPVLCAPCSKDGKRCFRVFSPYECMRGLSAAQVEEQIKT
jgi:ADP-heptose:LPS heptosyltransferase